eukprot:SAG31_NODE_15389_length_757_cov_1.551672_1_plen_184_part_10
MVHSAASMALMNLVVRATAGTAVTVAAASPPPTCGTLRVGEAFPSSKSMEGSVEGSFAGTAADCCHLCANNTGCAAITFFARTCFLHPVGEPLGPAARIAGKTSALVRPDSIPPPPTPPPPQPITPAPKGAKNVLFLISDDLRPEMLEAYGQTQMITPHFDKLARESLVLQRAYCQQAICGPTR